MSGQATEHYADIQLAHDRRRRLAMILAVLAIFVAVFVAWELKITGISMAGDANVSDSNADVETPAQWEASLPPTTDDWLENVAAIAESQVGYKESELNVIKGEDGKSLKGYTRYGAWYGNEYNDWDAMFASFCIHYAGVPTAYFPQSNSAYSWSNVLFAAGMYEDATSYIPKPGDIAFFDSVGDGREDTVAVVTEVFSNGVVVFVQGDKDGEVKRFASNSSSALEVLGFGVVPQNPEIVAMEDAKVAGSWQADGADEGEAEGYGEGEGSNADSGAYVVGEDANAAAPATATAAAADNAPATAADNANASAPANATAAAAASAAAPATNANATADSTKTTIAVCADWTDDSARANSVSMSLVQDANPEVALQTVTLSDANDWQATFKSVDLLDESKDPIRYHVVPSNVEGFDVEASASTVNSNALAQKTAEDADLVQIAKTASSTTADELDANIELDANVVEDAALSAEEAGGSLSSERTGLMLFSYAPAVAAYAVDDGRAAVATVPLTINKEWSDGNSNHSGEAITVNVSGTYAEDGASWSVPNVTISSADNWVKTVNVPTQGKTIASCEVVEASLDGYDSYADEVVIDRQTVWVPVAPADLTSTDVYALTYAPTSSNSYVYSLYDTGSTSISSRASYKGTGTVTVGGKEYYDYLTNVPADSQWRWITVDSGTYAGYHVLATNSSVVNNSNSANWRFIREAYSSYYDSNVFVMNTGYGNTSCLSYSSDKYLRAAYTSRYMAYESSSVSSKSYATKYTFYKRATAINGMSTTVHNRKTAAENESSTSVSVEKVWLDQNGNPDNESHANDSVTLHLVDTEKSGEVVAGTAPVVLSHNNWKADDIWQNIPEGSYSVVEDAVAGYNATVNSVQDRKTIWIPADNLEDGGIYAIVDAASARYLEAPNPVAEAPAENDNPLKAMTNASSARVQADPYEFGGHQYSGYLNDEDVPIAAQWTAFEKENGYSFRSSSLNAQPGFWMYYKTSDRRLWAYWESSVFTYDSATKMLSALSSSGLSSYYVGTSSYYSNYYGYNGDSYRRMQLYKRITLVDRTYTVTNAPITTQSGEAADVEVDHAKYIDALRDGVNNPDTSFAAGTDLTDMYRLYLDAGPADLSEPVDLLLVLDDSTSMTSATTLNGSSMSRTAALKAILTGDNGVISKFLAENEGNRVAAVSFAGAAPVYGTSYANDASRLSGWTDSVPSLDGLNSYGGTDYSAGLIEAQKLFDEASTSTNRKVMVFLSDGVPTFYVDENGDRHGHGKSDMGNATSCIEPSMASFYRFHQDYPDVITYTVGFSSEIAGNVGDVSSNPVVLRYYAEEGNGAFIQAMNADTLSEQLSKLILGGGLFTNASISDTLSDAVDLYAAQPDFKVVMQKVNKDGATVGQPVVLWNNSGAQQQFVDESAGGVSKDIIAGVTYDDATRTVTAQFDPNYAMDPEYRYTVSFNVRTTEKAYSDYVKDIAEGGDGYAGVKGDPDTDYSPRTNVVNETSSNKPGFYSNTVATLNFKRGNGYYYLNYEHPVVQVVDCSLEIKKVDADNQNNLLSGAKFSLYREARAGESVFHLDGLEGNYYQVATDLTTQNGVARVDDIEPGTYWIVEDVAPSGHTRDKIPHQITLTRDAIVVGPGDTVATYAGNENGRCILKYTNKAGYTLPYTGGMGDSPFTAAGLFLLVTSLAFGCVLARRRNERRLERASLQRR